MVKAISDHHHQNNMYLIEETQPEVNFSLKIDPFTEESITVKREPDDFDNRKTENEVDRDLDHKSTIQIHSHIKSEEEDYINSQYWISHEEIHIKPEDDVEQSDTQFKSHKKQIIHKCPDCPYQSNCIGNVKKHSIRHKKPDEIVWHRCTKCPYRTGRKDTLKQHAVIHNKFEIFKCAHCVYETTWKPNLKRHLHGVHHGENVPRIPSPEPERPYKNQRNLKCHLAVHNNDKFFKCTQCPYQTTRQGCLKTHQLKHESTDKWHACPQCPFRTLRKYSLRRHVFQFHANPDQLECYTTDNKERAKWLKCKFCSYVTWNKFDFWQHQMKHQEDDGLSGHKCPECPYKTPYKSTFLRHATKHKAADQTDWLQCPECSYRTAKINYLKEHIMLHTSVVEWFHCFDCPFRTNLKSFLVAHVKIHRQTGRDKLT